MTARGYSVSTMEADGTLHVRWIAGERPYDAKADSTRLTQAREFARGRASQAALGRDLAAALKPLGNLYRFDVSHWQVRTRNAIVLEFWLTKKGKASWRWGADGPAIKGMPSDLLAALKRGEQ